MVKSSRQKFKQRFRKSNITPQAFRNNYIPTDQENHESTNQVSTLLDKLRKEARFDNRTASTNISPTLPQPAFNYLMREHAEREQQERGEREVMRQRVSGPAPPKSWQKAWQGKIETTELLIKDRKEKRRVWDGPTLPAKTRTLLEICSKTVAINIKSYMSYPYFANMPTHLKQCILSSLSIYNPLTEDILPLFNTDTEYEELDLANSTINLDSLKKSFWKVVKEKDLVNNLVKNWEDLADQDEETDIICSRIFGKSMDIISDDDDSRITNELISKLPKLRKLNLGFTHNISGIPLSILLVATLPLLTHLSIAGCFNREDGPHSLRILSGLINLLVLDMSYCEWATEQILLQFINWDRDLKSLRILVAVSCGNWKDVEVIRKKLSENRRSFELIIDLVELDL